MKKGSKNQNSQPSENSNELSLKNEIIGILFLFTSIFLLFSVFSFTPTDPSFFNNTQNPHVENYGGRFGAQTAALIFTLFGFSSYILLFYLLFISGFFMFNKKIPNIITKSFGYLLLLLSFSSFLSSIKPYIEISGEKIKSGGIAGFFIAEFFIAQVKEAFSALLFLLLIIIALILVAKFSLRKILLFLAAWTSKFLVWAGSLAKKKYAEYLKSRELKRIREKYETDDEPGDRREKDGRLFPDSDFVRERPFRDKTDGDRDKLFKDKQKKQAVREPSRLPEETSLFADLVSDTSNPTGYQPPPLSYLDAATEKSKIDYKELEDKKEELKIRLTEFRIRGDIVEYTPGPVITTYEFVPDTGVKVKDVTSLAEDLALVAKAQYVRIERILGKKAIGIEIPNKKREIIHLREVLESEDYQNSRSPLTIALGKTKSGEIYISDLREMPHLIIAGATGSGKSVAIHSILLSILYKASPDEVKLVLIDPKRVELALYNTLPHLLTPVVVNTKLARNALDWAVFEMENRYKKLALLQVRSLDQYNKKLELMKQTEDELLDKLEESEKIPYIVIVIDEFADLMMESQREIETDIARIAQKARAVGIHLILATQRPSIDVITGTIKNNFPSRIALAVPSKHDSRTIIDVMGAEKLLGNGDMLFLPPKTASLVRLHCAFVSEEETLRVVNYLSRLGRPKFNTQVVKARKEEENSEEKENEMDELFYEAAETVISTGQASASYLQRKMSIGYARAGRLIDQLQYFSVVSASDNKNKREILMTLDELFELRKQSTQLESIPDMPLPVHDVSEKNDEEPFDD